MKGKIAILLVMIMLFTAILPLHILAAGDNGLENAIKLAKEKFPVLNNLVFDKNFYVFTENGKRSWNLNWAGKTENDGNAGVRIDENGTIFSYNFWKPSDYSKKKLPKISRQEALKKAEAFIKNINPKILPQIKLKDNMSTAVMDYVYYFEYARYVNGIPLYLNNVNVSVNTETGDVQSYNYNWTDGLTFPDVKKALAASKAQSLYKEKLGFKPIYKYKIENEKVLIYTVYTPVWNNAAYALDALTGEKIRLDYGNYGYDMGGGGNMEMAMKSASMDKAREVLSPEELKAVDEVSKLLTEEEAVKVARACKVLEIDDTYKLSSAFLNRDWQFKDEFYWELNFLKETEKDGNKESRSINVSINAKNSEIRNFGTYFPYNEGEKPKFGEAEAKAAVEKFLKEFDLKKFNETVYDENANSPIYYKTEEVQRNFTFNYTRKVNGIMFPENMLTVNFDAINGKVVSFYSNWFQVAFPAVNKLVPLSNVYKTVFDQIGFELEYRFNYPEEYNRKVGIEKGNIIPEVKLVYALKPGKPQFIDANKGIILDYEGKPYKENKPVSYTDISGSYAEKQIIALAESGISLEGTKFKPGEGITQLDFLLLLSKTLNYYYGPLITSESSDKDIDNLYNMLIREGIVKTGEKAPKAVLLREEGVKFIIRALKYGNVADIKGIFKCSYKDATKISSALYGYVAIAQGLNISTSNKGCFYPRNKLTRAEAAIMIYNYLQG